MGLHGGPRACGVSESAGIREICGENLGRFRPVLYFGRSYDTFSGVRNVIMFCCSWSALYANNFELSPGRCESQGREGPEPRDKLDFYSAVA